MIIKKSTRVQVGCEYCGKTKMISPSKFKASKSGTFYCSKKCRGRFRSAMPKSGKEILCNICGKKKYVFASQIKRTNNFYCSAKCQGIGYSKLLKHRFASGEIDRNKITRNANIATKKNYEKKFKINPTIRINELGYSQIYIPLTGYIFYHRYVWEKKNGPIPTGYIIHHIDKDVSNNKIENLKCMDSLSHQRLHKEKLDYNKYALPLYKKGLTDIEIANAIGAVRINVGNWRRKHNLKYNGKHHKKETS